MTEAHLTRVRALLGTGRRALLGVSGAPGSGKSTFASGLAERLRADGLSVALVPMDGFHLPQDELERRGLRDGSGRTIPAPDFDRTVEEPVPDAIEVGPDVDLVITEGNYLLDDESPWPDVRATLDEVWFVETDEARRLRRLLARHVEFGKSEDDALRWIERVDEPNARRIRATRSRADLVVTG